MLIEQAWTQLLPAQRWFAGKGRRIVDVEVRPGAWYPGSDPRLAVRPETLLARYADGATESYQAVTAYRPATGGTAAGLVVDLPGEGSRLMTDATADPAAFALVLDALAPDLPRGEIVPFPAEQSNTNVRIGDQALVKLYRRPNGHNREAELLAALTESGVTPRLHTAATTADGTTWAVVMEFVASTGDGWQLATQACRGGRDFTAEAADLGRALHGVHDLLRTAFGTSTRSGSDVAKGMQARLVEVAAIAPRIAELADRIRPLYAALEGQQLECQQIHGDFHLGQVLQRRNPPGWVLLDFEGEPQKSPQERREPDSVWRDVAGALRSFDYVRSAHAEPSGPAARAWSAASRKAFLDGYRNGAAVERQTLAAYLIDKAVYEVRYELRNRPDWVNIPLDAIEDELAGQTGTPAPEPKEQ